MTVAAPPSEGGRAVPSAAVELGTLYAHRHLLWAFVRNDLRGRYVGSSIGFFWTVVNPVLELVTYTFVFHTLLAVKFHPTGNTVHYVLFMFCGMMGWSAFADGVTRATSSITDHAHLLRKLHFPAILLPATAVVTATVNQLFRLLILGIGMLLIGDGLSWHALLVPLFVLIQATLTLGIGLFLATLNVYFRDTSHWVTAGLLIGMFVTPVFYPASAYPREFALLLYPNPMAQIIGVYQGLLLNHHIPVINSMLYAAVAAVGALIVGSSVFAHNRRHFSDLV